VAEAGTLLQSRDSFSPNDCKPTMNTDWSEEFETMAMKHYQLSSIPLWLIRGIWTDPRCMVSQPSLGFAK